MFTNIFISPPDIHVHEDLHWCRVSMIFAYSAYNEPSSEKALWTSICESTVRDFLQVEGTKLLGSFTRCCEYRCTWMPTLGHSNLDTHRSSPAPGYRLSIGSRCRPIASLHPAWPIAARTAGQWPDWGHGGRLSIYLYLYLFCYIIHWGVFQIQMFGYVYYVYLLNIFCFTSQFLQSNHTYLIPLDFRRKFL